MNAVTGQKLDRPVRDLVSAEEWQTRVDLAACYRLVGFYGMTDLTATHISARVPGVEGQFLINPHGMFFDEITASSLVKVDHDGNILLPSPYPVNRAGYVIHSAIHEARPDVDCVLHTHTRAGMAVSAMECGLLSISQHSMRFYNRLGYHDYEGLAQDEDEKKRLVRDLGQHRALMLRNHGLLTAGRTIPEAFSLIHYLEKCCQSQIDALASGQTLTYPSGQVCEHTARQYEAFGILGSRDWPGHLRRLDKLDPSYKE
ncbi:MAG: class II aldolase/adducin family protein [Alphaproteobacteria bacterium]|nr:class II aldolase/adducin family protein [Alphaproteobacteria bacterium]MBU0797549.1 class II aldolase/adducin family protein [Alphaproteobacteria bacterium]MBU0885880.1 class II aldolase/adducin family protein [Alphaproteobacteria bacterium]MBU1814620.1 class II aldolase/adducin family protein [Alphaproteobacteria bacterium]MBU2090617.1 class II aldolase/adducin family protein [Alphaproteobacteria bacterium]